MMPPSRWFAPEHSRGKVNAAGTTLVADTAPLPAQRDALAVVNNWRAAHGLPMAALHEALRERAQTLCEQAFTAQRLKRLSSMLAKLRRAPAMQLARMHDIGGCRAVLPTVDDVAALARECAETMPRQELRRRYDYLAEPRASGYRGVHLVYAYAPSAGSPGRGTSHAGLLTEMQLRSHLQHAWATAVETVDAFSGQALKSSEGSALWLRFFALMGTVIAAVEGQPPVPGTPGDGPALRRELKRCAEQLEAATHLQAYSRMLKALPGDVRNGRARYFHIYLEVLGGEAAQLRWNEYAEEELDEAIRAYEEVESAIHRFSGAQTVLVRVDSVDTLRRAYPNYFADTALFLAELKNALDAAE